MKKSLFFWMRFLICLLLSAIILTGANAIYGISELQKRRSADLPDSCRKEHYSESGYFDSLRASPAARVLLIENGTVFFTEERDGKPESFEANLTDETRYPEGFLNTDRKAFWLVLRCPTHKTLYRIYRAEN